MEKYNYSGIYTRDMLTIIFVCISETYLELHLYQYYNYVSILKLFMSFK